MRAVSFGSSVAQALRGPMSVSSFGDLARFDLGLNDELETALLDRLAPVYGQPLNPDTAYRRLLQESGETVINNLAVAQSIDTANYEPDIEADYPSSSYGRQLKQIAQLIKEDVGLEMATAMVIWGFGDGPR